MMGSIFYYVFADAAVGEYMKGDANAYKKIRDRFAMAGTDDETWETNWSCFVEYLQTFPSPVYQNAMYSMPMNWDWYVLKLAEFIEFALKHIKPPDIDKKVRKQLTESMTYR